MRRYVGLLFIMFTIFTLQLVSYDHSLAKELIKITDMANREVAIPKKIERVVALSGSLRYVVYLQAVDKIVGVEAVEKQPLMKGIVATGRPYNLVIRDRIKDLPVVGEGGPGKLPDMEKLLLVQPDLVIVHEADMAEAITAKTGIPAVVVRSIATDPWAMEDLKRVIHFLGSLLDREKRAKELLQYIDRLVGELNSLSGKESSVTFYVGAVSARGAHGISSTIARIPVLQFLKAKNIADEISPKGGQLFIDKEVLLAKNPKYLFIDTAGLPLVQEDYLKDPSFYQRLQAVKEKRVYSLLPVNFYRTNLEFLFANTFFVGKVLRPQEFAKVDPHKKTREILKTFLGRDVLDEVLKDYPAFRRIEFESKGLVTK